MIIKSISLLEGEYGKPIYRYDRCMVENWMKFLEERD